MTAPIKSPTQQAQEENTALRRQRGAWDTPVYEQDAQRINERYNRATTAFQAPESGIPQNMWADRLANTAREAATATQGVIGSVNTKRAAKAEREFAAWKAAQESSMLSMRNQFNSQMAGLQQSYMDGMNANVSTGAGLTSPSGGTGTRFADSKDNEIANWARQAGWAENLIPTVVQIARAESGANSLAINNKNRNGSIDYGLMQINTIHKGSDYAGGDFFTGGWKDPVRNLQAAKAIYDRAGGWTPWSVYNSGAYKKYQPQIVAQAQTVGGDLVSSSSGQLRQRIVQTAMSVVQRGVMYQWGGNNLMTGVDCSGLVNEVYKAVGIAMPGRFNTVQYRQNSFGNAGFTGTKTSLDNLQAGDLVVWNRAMNTTGHVAIYAGNGEIIEAQTAGKPVLRRKLNANDYKQTFGLAVSFK